MDSRLRTNDRIKDWIPAYAESTPRIGKKCSGGNDKAVGYCTYGATMHVEVMPCSWSW